MSTQTEQYPDFTGLTFETVWAMFKETDKKFLETDKKIQETSKNLDKLEKTVARTSREIGNLGNRFGEVIEHMVAAGAVAQFNALGFHFTHVSLRQTVCHPDTGVTLTELDIVLEDSDAVVGVEIKVKPNSADINKHIQRMQIYRESRKQSLPYDNKKIYGAIASPVFRDEIRQTILEAGFYTIEQSGKAIVIKVPEGFVPRAF